MAFERRFRAIAIEAYRVGKISRGRLAEIVDLDFDALAELLTGLGIDAPSITRPPERRNPLLADPAR
jgi:predicted HTH domain antitoxin